MRRTAPTASQPSRAERKPPAPPPGGWTLMEAAEALCPDAAALYRQGGAALQAAMLGDGDPNDPLTHIECHASGAGCYCPEPRH